ncbi:MAG: ROK family transcriptional regulator [Bacteroidales bacterium]
MANKFLNIFEASTKADSIKREILRFYALNGDSCISEVGKDMNLSIPTVTKFISELIEEGYVLDFGKQDTNGGRKPNIYGLNPNAGYFVGVDIRRHSLQIGAFDFKGDLMLSDSNIEFKLENTPEALDSLCKSITDFLSRNEFHNEKIISIAINMSGRVNSSTGYSYSTFYFNEEPLTEILEKKLGHKVYIENDSRSMCYGEYMNGNVNHEKNVIFINASWGLGMGLILDGKLYYGHSGFSGEFGHTPAFDNEVFCHCGKKGCLETGASGSAMYRLLMEKHKEGFKSILSKSIDTQQPIRTEDLVNAVNKEDMLMIDIIEEVGTNLGKGIASLINLFNPELVIIGGTLAQTDDYILLPIKSAVKKYSLNQVSKDTKIKRSKLGDKSGMIGACLIARNRILGLL